MAENITELEQALKKVHHSSKEARALKAKIASLQAAAEKPKGDDVQVDFKIDPSKTYTFHLLGAKPPYRSIPKVCQIFDEGSKTLRTIRYSRTEQSPFVDMQDPDAQMASEDIAFINGFKRVSGQDVCLIKYLMVFDGFAEKKTINNLNRHYKGMYALSRVDEEIRKSKNLREEIFKAGSVVINASLEDLKAFMRSEFGYIYENAQGEDKESALRDVAGQKAMQDPFRFTQNFGDPKHKYRAAVLQGLEIGYLKASDNAVIVADTNVEVARFEKGKSAVDAVVAYILSGTPGKEFYSKLESAIG